MCYQSRLAIPIGVTLTRIRLSVCSFVVGSVLAWSAAGGIFFLFRYQCWWLPFSSFVLPIVLRRALTVLAYTLRGSFA